jgi:uncharacterized membrane protein YcaP (DUF421 family)
MYIYTKRSGIPLLLLIPITAVVGVFGSEYKIVVVRVVVVYMAIFLGLRIWVKHEIRDMTPIDWLTLLLIPELAQEAFTGGTTHLHISVIGVASLLALVFIISMISPHLHIASRATVLVQEGKFVDEHLKHERIAPEEIMREIRKAGLEKLAQVKWAILEADGKISIIPQSKAR